MNLARLDIGMSREDPAGKEEGRVPPLRAQGRSDRLQIAMQPAGKGIAAILLSVAFHGLVAAAALQESPEAIATAGADEFVVTVIGNAEFDALMAGEPEPDAEEVPPQKVQSQAAETHMLPPDPGEAQEAAGEPETSEPDMPEAGPTQAETWVQEEISEPSPGKPAEMLPPPESSEIPSEALPVTPELELEKTAEPEVQPAEEGAQTLEALLEGRPVPIPRPRPVDVAAKSERRTATKLENKPGSTVRKKASPRRQNAGKGGQAQADSQRGASSGKASAQIDEAGKAAVANYPGKVARKLRRSLRYPSEARRQRLKGEVQVGFLVSTNGKASSIRVVRSSGHPILDQAALDTVRRAAPFPPLPDGRASWPFTVPLAFTR